MPGGRRSKGRRKQAGAAALCDANAGLTEEFQKRIRSSQLWGEMVAQFGVEKAEELLRECRAEVRRAGDEGADASGHRGAGV